MFPITPEDVSLPEKREKVVYRIAFYSLDGKLVKHQEAWPVEDNPTPQMAADIGASSHLPMLGAGIALVWQDVTIMPAERLLLNPPAQGQREFGPQTLPVPRYRTEVNRDADTILMLPEEPA